MTVVKAEVNQLSFAQVKSFAIEQAAQFILQNNLELKSIHNLTCFVEMNATTSSCLLRFSVCFLSAALNTGCHQ